MAVTTPTQGLSIIVDVPDDRRALQQAMPPGSALTSWVMQKVNSWEEHRNMGYSRLWGEYWRIWRGKWAKEDQNRQSERSRLIAPALSQAIEMTVSELEEAIFGREVWFDITDDLRDEDKLTDALMARDVLLEDLDLVNARDQILEAITNAAIFGTGIVKINVHVGTEERFGRNEAYELVREDKQRVFVTVESIRPDEFIPDPAGRSIEEMLGVAHRVNTKPLHDVLEKIEQGMYRKDALNLLMPQQRQVNQDIDQTDPQSLLSPTHADQVDIVEYHGKVPAKLLAAINRIEGTADDLLVNDLASERGDGELVEAIVTIANGSILLRAMMNPFIMSDRSIIAFQFEKVPGRFWGRGIAEKGYNPQKALDAEIRARIDALGFISSPMLGVDTGRIPKTFKLEIKPGKLWLTQGPPAEVLNPVQIGNIDANTFNQASEMERMVQMGTGAFDTATALKNQSQSGASGLSSNSMMMGAFVKRSKRSINNVDRNLLQPLIKKVMWRYMQFDPQRYPNDYKFNVKATMGIVAREVEAAQMTQLIGMLPEDAKSVNLTIAQGIIEHSTFANKSQILQQINEALKPPPPEVQEQQQQLAQMQLQAAIATAQGALLANQKTMAEIRKLLAEASAVAKKGDVEDDKLIQEQQKIVLMDKELDAFEEQNKIALKRLDLQQQQLDLKARELSQKSKEKKSGS